jgi:hypothetical protein
MLLNMTTLGTTISDFQESVKWYLHSLVLKHIYSCKNVVVESRTLLNSMGVQCVGHRTVCCGAGVRVPIRVLGIFCVITLSFLL